MKARKEKGFRDQTIWVVYDENGIIQGVFAEFNLIKKEFGRVQCLDR